MSEMHLLNLKNTLLVSHGRLRLPDILRLVANRLVNIAEFIRHLKRKKLPLPLLSLLLLDMPLRMLLVLLRSRRKNDD